MATNSRDWDDTAERKKSRSSSHKSAGSSSAKSSGKTSSKKASSSGKKYDTEWEDEPVQKSHSGKSSGSGKKSSSKKKKAKQRKRLLLFAVEIIALVVLLGAIMTVNSLRKMEKIDLTEEDIKFNPKVEEENVVQKGYRNIALFGVDSRKGKLGKGQRTDTIMIASINMDTKKVKLCSVYRDTYLNLGTDSYNKANSAYANGGAEQALNMLNWNLDMNISEYMTVGFDALIETIDALGGVDIDVHENEISYLNDYQRSMYMEEGDPPSKLNENIVRVTQSGMQTLNGLQATAYCRIRYIGNDYARTERQRRVLMACMEKAKQANPATLISILNKVISNTQTNLDLSEMQEILSDVASYEIVGEDGMPFEELRGSGKIGSRGSCVVPLDLEANVKKLHEFLFGVVDYEPSDQVKEYSRKIASDISGYKIDR